MVVEVTQEHKKAIAANLRDFGYDVTDEYVSEQVDAVLAGVKATNIIAMTAESMLRENGLLAWTAASESTKQRWHVETQEVSDGGRIPLTHTGVFVRNELGENIAKTIAEQANLIAAAPLLLAAAEKAIRELDADHACLFCAANVRGVDATAFHPAHEEHAEDCPEPALRAAVAAARGEGSAQ